MRRSYFSGYAKLSRFFPIAVQFMAIPLLVSAAFADNTGSSDDLKAVLLKLVGSILGASLPIAFFVGAMIIGFGIKRFADGNSAPHGGKGAITMIVTGSLIMNLQFTVSVIVKTFSTAGIDFTAAFSSYQSVTEVDALIKDVMNAMVAVFFLGGAVMVGMGVFAFANKDQNPQQGYGAWKKVVAGAILLTFTVLLGVLNSTLSVANP